MARGRSPRAAAATAPAARRRRPDRPWPSQARWRSPCSTTALVAMSRGAAVASDRASSARSIGTLAMSPTSSRSMTTTKLRITASRSRRHDVEWTRIGGPTTSRTIRSTTSTGCSVAPSWRIHGCGPSGPVSCEPVAVEPHDEDLGLDRAVDVPTGGCAAHSRHRSHRQRIHAGCRRRTVRRLGARDQPQRSPTPGSATAASSGRRLRRPRRSSAGSGRSSRRTCPGALWAHRPADAGDPTPIDDARRRARRRADRPDPRARARRGTSVLPDDLRWIQALTGPRVQPGRGSMYRRLELDDRTTLRAGANGASRAALAGGQALTRDELAVALAPPGSMRRPTASRSPTRDARRARGGDLQRRRAAASSSTYMLVDERGARRGRPIATPLRASSSSATSGAMARPSPTTWRGGRA